jgi:hypothetical protein
VAVVGMLPSPWARVRQRGQLVKPWTLISSSYSVSYLNFVPWHSRWFVRVSQLGFRNMNPTNPG